VLEPLGPEHNDQDYELWTSSVDLYTVLDPASRVTRGGIFIWRTTDEGRSFSKPQAVYIGRGFQDHPWLAANGTHLYLAWTNDAGLEFSASDDAGKRGSALSMCGVT
jgi:hypothetical protein